MYVFSTFRFLCRCGKSVQCGFQKNCMKAKGKEGGEKIIFCVDDRASGLFFYGCPAEKQVGRGTSTKKADVGLPSF